MWEQLTKKGYEIHNKRILGNPLYTSKEAKHKDLVQELALVQDWLYEKHSIWIYSFIEFKNFYVHIQTDWNLKTDKQQLEVIKFMNNKKFNSPTEAKIAAIEYTINNLI